MSIFKLITEHALDSKCWCPGPVIIQATCDMTLDLDRVHICHSETLALETILFRFHPKNEMKILVKMI